MNNEELSVKGEAAILWAAVLCELGVRVISPYRVRIKRTSLVFLGYLPDFGSPNGTVTSLLYHPNSPARTAYAKQHGMFYSELHLVNDICGISGLRTEVIDALYDWGYYGPKKFCPKWFREGQRRPIMG
jgi:hypothetical protein